MAELQKMITELDVLTSYGNIHLYGESLKCLKMPVSYVIGEKDSLVPLRDVQIAHRITPNSRLYVFKDCKHWIVKEQPEEFCAIVEELCCGSTDAE